MQNRGAIGLSVNFLVIIIISVVILAGGVALLYKFIGDSESLKETLDARTEQELERLIIDQGKQVALPFQQIDLERAQSHAFGLGILNIDSSNNQFQVHVSLSKHIDGDGNETILTSQQLDLLFSNIIWNEEWLTIEENEHSKQLILVEIPPELPTGTYIFNVKVFKPNGDQYHNTQKMYVSAK